MIVFTKLLDYFNYLLGLSRYPLDHILYIFVESFNYNLLIITESYKRKIKYLLYTCVFMFLPADNNCIYFGTQIRKNMNFVSQMNVNQLSA